MDILLTVLVVPTFGVITAFYFFGDALCACGVRLREQVRARPFAALALLPLFGVCVSYAATKPPPPPREGHYRVVLVAEGVTTLEDFECGKVYNIPHPECLDAKAGFAGWAGSNGRRYDPGVLVFDLVPAGGTITLTAILE